MQTVVDDDDDNDNDDDDDDDDDKYIFLSGYVLHD